MWHNYLKIARRNLLAQRRYTLLNGIGLAVGLAGTLLIYLFLRHHLDTDRHHTRFDRIVRIDTDLYLEDGSVEFNAEAPLPMAAVLRSDYPQVEQAAFLSMIRDLTVSVGAGSGNVRRFLEHSGAGLVGPEWFSILSYTWLQGDPKTALSAPNQVVLTESWARRYFGDANPVGQTLVLNNKLTATVTGLLAETPRTTDTDLGLFVSLASLKGLDPEYDQNSWLHLSSSNRVYATLRSAGDLAGLQRAMPALSRKQYGEMAPIFRFVVQPLRELHFDTARDPNAIRPSLLWALAVVGLLILGTACINFVNLATVQALRRSKEVGIRKTLGSSRGQLVRQFMLETALLTVVAMGLALLLAWVALPVFRQWVGLPLRLQADGLSLAFFGLLLLGVTGLAGAYPSAILSGLSPWAALRGKLSGPVGGSLAIRRGLVVLQFAVCQALLVGSLVVVGQVRYMQRADLGFRKENVVVVPLPPRTKTAQDAFKQTLRQYPDIRAITLSHLPPSSDRLYGGSIKFDGRPDWEPFPTRERLADADFLPTYGLKLLAGRNIQPSDTIREYLINETLMRKLGFQQPERILGKRLQHYLSPVPLPIVGVVRDFHLKSLREEIAPCVVACRADSYRQAGIRIAGGDPARTLERIRQVWQRLYPDEVFEYQFLDDHVAQLYQTESLLVGVIQVFTGLAILISCLGLYGLVSQVVLQRTKEIGIRKVLGASVSNIVILLSGDFLRLTGIAIVLASPPAAWVMKQWLDGFAFRISLSGWLFATAAAMAVGVALLTISGQTLRAALANPVTSLRNE